MSRAGRAGRAGGLAVARPVSTVLTPVLAVLLAALALAGCAAKDRYGIEARQKVPAGTRPQVWAVAPAVNLSGERGIDPLLQADLLFGQVQRVRGITAVPVNRTVQVFAALQITHIRGQADADLVCDALRCDGVVIPAITAYDPYDPPKVGASLALFLRRSGDRPPPPDPLAAGEAATPGPADALPPPGSPGLVQATGYFDAANGSVRYSVEEYARGRFDPDGPTAGREYYLSTERYCGWVYSRLLDDLLLEYKRATVVGE